MPGIVVNEEQALNVATLSKCVVFVSSAPNAAKTSMGWILPFVVMAVVVSGATRRGPVPVLRASRSRALAMS